MTPPKTSAATKSHPRSLSTGQRERRKRILETTNALLAAHGYDAVSMKMIAERAGVAERTLFNIYETKDALVATSARERTEEIIAEACANARDPGIGFFLSLCETLSRKTLEAPEVARGLAPVLVHHADLVGLHEVYRRYVGEALETLAHQSTLEGAGLDMLTTLVSMRMANAVTSWAGGTIPDAALEVHMRLAVCEVLLPHARAGLRDWAQNEARQCLQDLCRMR